jgi:UTP:GlnB (protein PII) uridylyltransferase
VTTPSSTVKDTFRVTCQGGEALTETRLASIRTAIVNAASASAISKTAASTQPRAVDAKVEVMSFEDPAAVSGMSRPTWIIGISVEDSPGLLSKMMKAMSELGLDVLSADIKTTHGTGMIKFQVLRREGLKPQAVVDAIKAALKHA